ncbi:MAG: FAD-dependent oxidoreductase [Candidatus Woesearchaeota archaeon]|jgi:NAD(P)H-flavin reductase|nr:FAD-dependent oxidoreductase [Candidatus Woesearchaeota archaeon]
MPLTEYKGKLTQIKDIGDNARHFVITFDQEFNFKAGQFLNLSFHDKDEDFMRPYSIASSSSNNKQVELCIKKIDTGKVTPHLFKKVEGDEVIIRGPFGLFTLEKCQKEKIVFIATGTGIAPFRSMTAEIIDKHLEKEIILIYGTRQEDKILYKEEFEKIEKENPNFKYVPIISRPTENWEGRKGYVQDNLDMIDVLNSEVYMCGLPAMIETTEQKLQEKGIPKELIHFEKF